MDVDERAPLLGQAVSGKPAKNLVLIFVGLALSVFISALDETIVATSAISIVSQFKAFDYYALVSVSYLVALNASQPLYGKLSDIFGRRPAILFAVTVFLGGSIGCAWATSMIMFITSRCIAGIGAGGLTGVAFIIVADLFPLEDRPKYQSILMSGHGIAAVIGPLLGGAFTKRLTWRWCFWINIPICLVTLVLIAAFLHLPRPEVKMRTALKSVDFSGAFTLVSAVVCIMVPAGLGGNYWAWDSAPVISLFAGGIVFLAVFLFIEHSYAANPIVPLRLWTNINLVRAWMTLFFYGMSFFTFMYYLPVWFEVVEGSTPEVTGLQLIPLLVGHVSAGLLFAPLMKLASRLPFTPIRTLVHAAVFFLLIGSILRTVVRQDTHKAAETAVLLVYGFGAGLTLQTSFVSAQAASPPEDLATSNSLAVFFENLGGSFGLSISAVVNRWELGRRFSNIPSHVVTRELLDAIQRNPNLVREPGVLEEYARSVVVKAFSESLYLTFKVSVGFALLAYLSVLVLRYRQ